ncbi:hypothetical protein BDR05DRAFT_1019555 [Suillus weaverae]|nr:hypothetical protein BDR05DRAFT_1019555 [Suillus weaverae]
MTICIYAHNENAEIASSREELDELQTKAGVIEAAIEVLEKKILEISDSKLLKQKSTDDGICWLHQLANEEVTKAAEVMFDGISPGDSILDNQLPVDRRGNFQLSCTWGGCELGGQFGVRRRWRIVVRWGLFYV